MTFKYSLFAFTVLVSCSAFAGGSIFSHHKTSNAQGVSSVGIYVCGNLTCPDVIIKQGDCIGIEHASMKYGVCVCDDGFKVKDGKCAVDSKPTVDGWTGDETTSCDISLKPGLCSVCLSVDNTVAASGQNEFWANSNALCPANEVCANGSCQSVSGTGCVKNSDCSGKTAVGGGDCGTDKCYCNYGNSYNNLDYPTTTGTCSLNNDYLEFSYGDPAQKRIIVHTKKDVWSSKNFCESLKMRLMTWNEINCTVTGGKVSLNYSEGTHLKKALETIYETSSSGFFQVVGYTEDYALVKAGPTFSELYSSSPFFFCR